MKNYKIIETRPEIPSLQVEQGMDFAKIKSKAAVASKSATVALSTKAIILNSVAGAVLIGGAVFGIKQFNKEPLKENKQTAVTMEAQKPNQDVISTSKDSVAKVEEVKKDLSVITPSRSLVKFSEITTTNALTTTPTQTVPVTASSIVETAAAAITESDVIDPVESTTIKSSGSKIESKPEKNKKFVGSKNVKCTILNENPYSSYPESLVFPLGMECLLGCEFKYISCDELNSKEGVKAVLVHIESPTKKILLKTNFSNITLIRNGKSITPIAIGLGDLDEQTKKPKYLHQSYKSQGAILRIKKNVDLLLFFSEPKEGDHLVFDGLHSLLQEQ